MVAENLKLGTR